MRPLYLILSALLIVAAAGCEDPAPTDYVPQHVVEGFMIVDEPIRGITVALSQSVADTFRYPNSAIKDADVKIMVEGRTLQLVYLDGEGIGQYYYPDTTELVKPGTEYQIQVTTTDGVTMTGRTTTPSRIEWISAPREVVQYPKDTIVLPAPDSLSLSWTAAPGVSEYIVAVRCLDTLQYGRYLSPSTTEGNRRIIRFFDEGAPFYNDVSRIGFVQSSGTPISWFGFKWFGPQEVVVYAPDGNFVNWYKLTHFQPNPQFEPLLGNIKGGIGVFASASVVRKNIFVLKNQP